MRYRTYRGYSLTPIWGIMIVCFLVYIATLISRELVFLLALQRATFLLMPWTILTNLFTHISLWHLLANMMTLYFFGSFSTRLIGTRNFLIIYFLGGIMGNIFCLLLTSSPVIGASGAIFALGGTLTVLTPKLRVFMFPIPVPLPLWVAIIGGFIVLTLFPNVAWQGHLGGLILGVIAGFVLRNRIRTLLR